MWVESSLVAPPSFDLQIVVESLEPIQSLAGVCWGRAHTHPHTHTHTHTYTHKQRAHPPE